MSCVYSPVDFSLWNIFSKVNKAQLEKIILIHIFGERGSSGIFITNDDIVYGIGSNIRAIDPFKLFSLKPDMFGYLGIGETVHTNVPIEITELSNQKIICFSSGLDHTLALSETGDLWVWGKNNYHQIGNHHTGTLNRPFLKYKNMIKSISTGNNYTLLLLNNNTVLHFGSLNDKDIIDKPTLINFETNIKQISCGSKHASALDFNGNVFIWGDNSNGQLGHYGQKYCDKPFKFDDHIVEKISCSSTATFIIYNQQISSYGCVGDLCLFKSPVIDITTTDQILSVQTSNGYFNYKIIISDKMFTISPITVQKNWINIFSNKSTPQFIRQTFIKEKPIYPKRDLNQLYNNQEYSDLIFKLQDGDVYVHKLIIKTFSNHFKNLDPNIELIDVQIYNPKAYRCYLKYIYTGDLDPLDTLELIELYGISISYTDNILKDLTISIFRTQLNNQNVSKCYELSKKFMYDDISKICQEYASCLLNQSLNDDLAYELGQIILTPEIVSNTYKYAKDCNLIQLKKLCADYACRNWEQVVLSSNFEKLSPQIRCDFMKDLATIKSLEYTEL